MKRKTVTMQEAVEILNNDHEIPETMTKVVAKKLDIIIYLSLFEDQYYNTYSEKQRFIRHNLNLDFKRVKIIIEEFVCQGLITKERKKIKTNEFKYVYKIPYDFSFRCPNILK